MTINRSSICLLAVCLAAPAAVWAGSSQAAKPKEGAGKPQTVSGLEMSVQGLERTSSASLNDCPPGTNREKGLTKPGEEFAVITVNFKVTPSYKPSPLKRPVVHDAADNTFYTAVSFVDVGKILEFSCAFPFRIPTGTALKSLEIDQATFDLMSLSGAKP